MDESYKIILISIVSFIVGFIIGRIHAQLTRTNNKKNKIQIATTEKELVDVLKKT